MEPKDPIQTNAWPSVARTVLMLAVLVGLALGIRATRSIAAPILLGLVVVIGASPLVGILTKRRVPSVLAYIISLLVIVIVILALLFLMSFMIFQTRDLLPQLQDQLTALEQDFVDTLAGWGIRHIGGDRRTDLETGERGRLGIIRSFCPRTALSGA